MKAGQARRKNDRVPVPPATHRVGVACSGGRDSTALLHATARVARPLGLEVFALHVHHGLLPEADEWWQALEARCRRWRRAGWPVTFCGVRLEGRPARGDSVEAWARRERYRALTALARDNGIDLVLLAHHRRDQAETFLLQALRGAGAPGLAAMPQRTWRESVLWARPWLAQPVEAVEHYLRRHRLGHVKDPSNSDPRYARSRLRAELWPSLLAGFPQAEASLCAAAGRMQEAASCLQELAQADAHGVVVEGGLKVLTWLELGPARRANLLRSWSAQWSPSGLPQTLLRRLADELPSARSGNCWPAPGGWLRLRGGWLRHEADPGPGKA